MAAVVGKTSLFCGFCCKASPIVVLGKASPAVTVVGKAVRVAVPGGNAVYLTVIVGKTVSVTFLFFFPMQ